MHQSTGQPETTTYPGKTKKDIIRFEDLKFGRKSMER